MLKYYMKEIIDKPEIKGRFEKIVSELKGKRVIVIGDKDSFIFLNRKYQLIKYMNIIAYVPSDKKTKLPAKYGIKNINQEQIFDEVADALLIVDENSYYVYNSMKNLENFKVVTLFEEEFKDENMNLDYLIKYKFDKTLKKLKQKLKGKKVLFYGGGLFFRLINKYYDLSQINAIGVVDKQCSQIPSMTDVCGYKIYKPEDIKELNPDYVVVSTKRIIAIAESLYFDYLKGTNIKITPLVKKGFWATFKDG